MPRLALVIVALVVISFVASFCIYYFITDAVSKSLVAYTQNFANIYSNSSIPQPARSYNQLQIVSSVCKVSSIENLSKEDYGRYYEDYTYVKGPCDKEKIEGLSTSDDYEALASYVSLSSLETISSISKHINSYIEEKSSQESFLLVEKLYDINGLLFLVQSESSAWLTESRSSDFCYTALNKSPDCYHAILDAENRVAVRLQAVLSGADFEQFCRSIYEQTASNNPRTSMILDINTMCPRVGSFMRYIYQKSMQDQDMSKYEKYMKLLVFKMLSSSDHTAASKEILLMIGDELPPQYKSVFVNATNTLFEKISK